MDEASIEDVIRSKGYGLAYIPDAIVTNHGPETWREYFEQRRRIARGHYWLDFAFGYSVATLDQATLMRTAIDVAREEEAFGKQALAAAIATEVAARAAGFFDARILGGKHRTWKQLGSTKRLKDAGSRASEDRQPTARRLSRVSSSRTGVHEPAQASASSRA